MAVVVVALLAARPCGPPGAAAAGATLTGAAAIGALYDRILDADFEAVAGDLRACAGLPREACDVLEATRVWWRILLDPESRALDPAFQQAVDRAIASAGAWTRREPRSAEAWFYLGGAYGARVQWRVLRLERLAAARDGKRIKDALERALSLDPALEDANFGIGLYQYYADVAPAALRFLRMLLLLPGGDKAEGLARMLRARDRGQLLRGEAEYQLHVIDLWYEEQFARALERLRGLERRYPRNPHFTQLIAEVQDVYFHEPASALATWRRLLDRARRGEVREAAIADARARLGAARHLDALEESDAAIDVLRPVVEARPAAPHGAAAAALLQTGLSQDRLGLRDEATRSLESVAGRVPPGDPTGLRARAREALRRRQDPATARAYRLSLEGWRAFGRGDRAGAERALRDSLRQREDVAARYRLAHVLRASGAASALSEYERVIAAPAARAQRPTFYADACAEAAALHERAGRRAEAAALYERAAATFGASSDRRAEAAAHAARLRRSPPAAR
jgi:hypothetical protein